MTHPDNVLDRFADLAGISPRYWDIFGTLHETSPDAKRAILTAMGFDISSPAAIAASFQELEAAPWRAPLPPLQVARRGTRPAQVRVILPEATPFLLRWQLVTETGETFDGETDAHALPCLGTYTLDGTSLSARALTLPDHLPDGYHRLTVETPGGAATGTVALAPNAAYRPDWLNAGQRQWGLSCQLYALRGGSDWGIGDLGDLGKLAEQSGRLGAGAIGLNPLHALLPRLPELCSPYFPSSRLFLNPLYIDISAVAEAGALPADFSAAVEPDCKLVDYPAVAALKDQAFTHLFAAFSRCHGKGAHTQRRAAFDAFVASGGEALRRFCLFEALHVHFNGRPWSEWPAGFGCPDSPAVRAFAAEHPDALERHAYLQWIADGQLANAAQICTQRGMAVGLYRDLAVGTDPLGADAWASPSLLASNIRFGAPPDAFNPKGQDWGMSPPLPLALRNEGYRAFIDVMRANMRHAGALRIDHVMALQHLYWIPQGAAANEGAYVSYPLDDLLGLLALESHRHRCLVIGEDLGTVPDEFRARTEAESLLSYRVLYFERYPNGLFKRPELYPADALATATTHDMPTIAGHWHGHDLELRAAHGLLPPGHDEASAAHAREEERSLLLAALEDQGLRPAFPPGPGDGDGEAVRALILAIERFIARTPSCLAMVSLTDALAETEMHNLPGTVDEHPNWRRRLAHTVEKLADDTFLHELAAAIAQERKRPTTRSS